MTTITQKRYQYRGPKGICWSDWYDYKGKDKDLWQEKGKLKNEYRTIEREV